MKQTKFMNCLETFSAGSLLVSKYLLAIGSVSGWVAGVTGYFLTATYNFKKDIKIIGVVVIGLLLLCAYGWYKWSFGIKGLQIFDYCVIILTIFGGLGFAYSEWKSKKPLWFQQTAITLLCMAAYVLLGLGLNVGWYCLAVAHCFLCYVYYKKGAYVFVAQQVISVYIALTKVTSLPLPF